ncbi:hypothetical protein KSP40_PGU020115 [Platanthera guangdongensis]|uniref:Uncharacterized protein n=1 Tax=Platanthera guangdongensis TaxID=2320717 RepID=A0ABR2MZE0_9ASPA
MRFSVRKLAGVGSSESDPEEMKLHSPPQPPFFTSASFVAGFLSFSRRPAVFPILIIIFLILSFINLHKQHPSLWNLSLAFAIAGAAALLLKMFHFSLFIFRLGRREPVWSFIGDEEGDLENPTLKKIEIPLKLTDVKSYRNGCSYQGEFSKGKWDGSGVFNFAGQGKYAGDWVCGKYHGYGTETSASGNMYEGGYRRGLRHGFGVHTFYNGDSYAGEWKEGLRHGRGAQRFCDGSCFVGEFVGGDKHGLGCYHFRNGDKYEGQYFGELIHGFGVYRYADGRSYEGSWRQGKRHGFGAYALKNGEAIAGEWNCGALKNPLPLADSNVQLAVKSARKASVQSLLLPRDIAEAHTSVARAQRAASAARIASAKAVHNQKYGMLWNWPEDKTFSLPLRCT